LIDWKHFIFAFFLVAGTYKADSLLAWVPFDLTFILAVLVVIFLVINLLKRGATIAPKFPILLFFFILIAPVLLWTEWTPYALDKTTRFWTLTLLAFFTPAILFKSVSDVNRVVTYVFYLMLVVCAQALYILIAQNSHLSRLYTESANTIQLGKAAGLSLLYVLVLLLRRKIRFPLAVASCVCLIIVLLSSGARGPLTATIIATFILIYLSPLRLSNKSKIAFGVVVIAGIVVWIGASNTILDNLPTYSSLRLQNYMAGNIDLSGWVRLEAYKDTLDLILKRPLGVGLGNWPDFILIQVPRYAETLRYPHNIFLEIFLEAGWLPGTYFCVLVIIALIRARRSARAIGNQSLMPLYISLVFFLICALFSGDVNDNRILFPFVSMAIVHENSMSDNHVKPATYSVSRKAMGVTS